MQHKLKQVDYSAESADSTFDAVREMIAKDADLRGRHAANPSQPKSPASPSLSQQSSAAGRDPEPQSAPQPKLVAPAPRISPNAGMKENAKNPIKGLPTVQRLATWRPRAGVCLVVAAGVMVVLQPVLSLVLVLFLAALLATSYALVGYDAFWGHALRPVRRHVERHPENAEKVHRRIDQFAVRWDAVLDRLPERWVGGFYLPDVSDIAAVAEREEAAIDLRLRSLAKA